jgi:3-dehydroquinate dehydratase/shikimate dehydrogenase
LPQPAVVASLTAAPDPARLRELAGLCEVLEVRADLFPEPDVAALREGFPGRLLYTLRSAAEGGEFRGSGSERHARLGAAAQSYDLVDLEELDLGGGTLEDVPAERRVLSWHGAAESLEELQEVAARLLSEPAHWYKMVTLEPVSGADRWPLMLMHGLRRSDFIAFATGETGRWTRLLSPLLGAPAVFTAGGPLAAAPGQIAVESLVRDYAWPLPEKVRWILGVVGRPVSHSLSPYLFNRALRRLEIPGVYVPFHAESFGEFWLEVVEEWGFPEADCSLRGLSVTAPYKRVAVAVAGAASPLAETIRSANTLVCHEGVWEADSTDAEGVLGPLRRRQLVLRGKPAAVLGAGGAGRAAAYALDRAGVDVTLFNRGEERRRRAAEDLELPCLHWDEFEPSRYSLVVHATPLGRGEDDPLPCDPTDLQTGAIGFDLVYRRTGPTPWVSAVRDCGHVGIDGREALLHQAVPQFAAMTGHEMPSELVEELLDEMEAR